MKSLFSLLKFFIVIAGCFAVIYVFRHTIFPIVFQKAVSHVSSEKFEYKSRAWDGAVLVYEDVALGNQLQASRLRLMPQLSFFPLHFALAVECDKPRFNLSSETQVPMSLALLAPTRWSSFKLDVSQGLLVIDGNSLGSIDFVSSAEPSALGTLILSEEELGRYCSCEISYDGTDFFYLMTCEAAPVLRLQTLFHFFSLKLPFELQGGSVDACLKGDSVEVQGTVYGRDLQIATDLGEFDFQGFSASGRWGSTISVEGQIGGGRFNREMVAVDDAAASFSFGSDRPPRLALTGSLAIGDREGPFSCNAEGASAIEGKLQYLGLNTPFTIAYGEGLSTIKAHLLDVPLVWLKEIVPFEEGYGAAIVTAIFEHDALKAIELGKVVLSSVKIREFACKRIEGRGVIRTLEKIDGEFALAASVPIHGFEAPISFEGVFQLDGNRISGRGDLIAFSDHVALQGAVDLKSFDWSAAFESSEMTLSNYSTYFSEGSAAVKGAADAKELRAQCAMADVVIQTEDKVLKLPGQLTPLELQWSLQNHNGTAKVDLTPSTLYVKTIPTPIHIEGGHLTWDGGSLRVEQLQACVNETVFQGDVVYIPQPAACLQLTGRSCEGTLGDLSLFGYKIDGWDGHFSCQKLDVVLDKDLKGGPQIELKAHVNQLTHQNILKVSPMEGDVQLAGQSGRYAFFIEIPREHIALRGDISPERWTFHQAEWGRSKITHPLEVTFQGATWVAEGSGIIDLSLLSAYVPLPSVQGMAAVSGVVTEERASIHLDSNEITVGAWTLPHLKGHVIREGNQIRTRGFIVGDARATGFAVFEKSGWHFPELSVVWKDLSLHGFARLENDMCVLQGEGAWKDATLKGELRWDIQNARGSGAHFTLEKQGCKLVIAAPDITCHEGQVEVPQVEAMATHPQLKEPAIAQLSLKGSFEKWEFQGPFLQAAFRNELFELKAQEIYGRYENGVVHYLTKLQCNDTPLQAKGYFSLEGQGVAEISEGERKVRITFAPFPDISRIEGKLFGLECSLTNQREFYEGRLIIETTGPLAKLLKKPEWKLVENLELIGSFTQNRFKGDVIGQEAVVLGYLVERVQAAVEYTPLRLEIRNLKIDDQAGQLAIKECIGKRSHPQKAWEVTVPHLRGQHIQPSLLRTHGAALPERKPFQIRQLTLTNLTGIVGRPLTFQGVGMLCFTQKEKRDPSLFDLPRAFLKEWGLDLALLSPAYGSANIELSRGKIVINGLKDVFSDGGHSEFYLSPDEVSYIDFAGALFLNLRMKQKTSLKLAEPFTISVRGTWEKPHYTLR